jgi:hypothetical protein
VFLFVDAREGGEIGAGTKCATFTVEHDDTHTVIGIGLGECGVECACSGSIDGVAGVGAMQEHGEHVRGEGTALDTHGYGGR